MTTASDIENLYWDWRKVWEEKGYPADCLAALTYHTSADFTETKLIGIKFLKNPGVDRVFDRFEDTCTLVG
jgi:hypothetical protein